jgi:histidinol-phosphate aminotransferase
LISAYVDKLRLPYNINTLTQVSANFLLREKEEINKNAQIILSERTKLSVTLSAITALKIYPSQANFILFKAPNQSITYNDNFLNNSSIECIARWVVWISNKD